MTRDCPTRKSSLYCISVQIPVVYDVQNVAVMNSVCSIILALGSISYRVSSKFTFNFSVTVNGYNSLHQVIYKLVEFQLRLSVEIDYCEQWQANKANSLSAAQGFYSCLNVVDLLGAYPVGGFRGSTPIIVLVQWQIYITGKGREGTDAYPPLENPRSATILV